MKKFITDKLDDYTTHYQYCASNCLPFLKITPAGRFAHIEFDVIEMVKPKGLPDEQPSEFITDLYVGYARFVNLPSDKFSCCGGSNNLILTVYREHAYTLATLLYDHLLRFVTEGFQQTPE